MRSQPRDSRPRVLDDGRALVMGFMSLRRAVGLLGMALPWVVSLGGWLLFGTGLQPSISAYYHTPMRDVFVGTLCAIGVFLLSYRGYDRRDDLAGTVASVCAVGLALFPTREPGASATTTSGYLHLVFTAGFLVTLAYFSLALFTKTHPDRPMTPRKKARNRVYRACGIIMLTCLGGIVLIRLLRGPLQDLAAYRPVFWLEAVAIFSFGVSWMTKGEALLQDREDSQ